MKNKLLLKTLFTKKPTTADEIFVDFSSMIPKGDFSVLNENLLNDALFFTVKGVALGDYAGQPYEGHSLLECMDLTADDLYKKSKDCTDDTILTCATAKALRNQDVPLSSQHFGDVYKEYVKEYPSPLGSYGGHFLSWVYTGADPNSCGNGSAMRVSPCGCMFANPQDVAKAAYKSAVCSHSHPEGIKGAIVTAMCVFMALQDKDKKAIGDYVAEMYPDSPYSPSISWKKIKHYKEAKGNPAVCQTTVPMAVSCFVNSESYEDCILKAIQFGWDTDTQAAVAGSIAGAYYKCFSDKSNERWEIIKENKYIKEVVE